LGTAVTCMFSSANPGLLWTAPEMLPSRRRRHSGASGSTHPYYHGSISSSSYNSKNSNLRNLVLANQKGDSYSFAIILYELYGKAGPWGHIQMTNK
ncbi:unnamed protein product, partial [Candidula unifasciata]